MSYRIIATLLLLVCVVGAGVLLEYQQPSASPAPAAASPAADDSAMQSLRIP
ncbi:hypothetical protein [Comamonas sp. Z1]|uniref:hypothetical protein n=1 Tax=Comamonas sp. Z1 TaxID=2601246 RepID=UPI0016531A40|nr:hypothetical protein [Comamonas sp. Z1]